eukprot:GHVN01024928.1.p1 GENE.GHVN01024928.1~~GHVN01024928.1.p1  ORF type:complete len:109 (+),score=3.38 GHVN01024928.1:28-354(+)
MAQLSLRTGGSKTSSTISSRWDSDLSVRRPPSQSHSSITQHNWCWDQSISSTVTAFPPLHETPSSSKVHTGIMDSTATHTRNRFARVSPFVAFLNRSDYSHVTRERSQ